MKRIKCDTLVPRLFPLLAQTLDKKDNARTDGNERAKRKGKEIVQRNGEKCIQNRSRRKVKADVLFLCMATFAECSG